MTNVFSSLSRARREAAIAVAVFLAAAFLFIGLTVWGTTIGTNIDATGTLGAATSTPWGDLAVDQVEGKSELRPVFVVGDNATATPAIFVSQKGVVSFGSSTPSDLFLNVGDVVIGRHGATSDLYVSGGLGVGDATTTDSAFVVGSNLFLFGNGNLFVGGTTTDYGFVVETKKFTFSTGDTSTSTLQILNEAAANGANSCIEMSSDGLIYRIMINGDGNDVLVEAGTCAGD